LFAFCLIIILFVFLHRLRNAGIKVRFVTNETQVTKRGLVCKLNKLGYELNETEVFSPGPAMAKILKENGQRPFLLIHKNVSK
jgi:ribonucleotide monophosphatase NagD (HAD superfamily)